MSFTDENDISLSYGFIHALKAALPIIKGVTSSLGQEFDKDELIEVFVAMHNAALSMTTDIAKELAISPDHPRQKGMFLSILQQQSELIGEFLTHNLNMPSDKKEMIEWMQHELKRKVTNWHRIPFIETTVPATQDQNTQIQIASLRAVSKLHEAVREYHGGLNIQETVKSLSQHCFDLVEEFSADYAQNLSNDEATIAIQVELIIQFSNIISDEWKCFVRDRYRSGVPADKERIKAMLKGFTGVVKEKNLGHNNPDIVVEYVAQKIIKISDDKIFESESGCSEFNDMYRNYLISRCSMLSRRVWESFAENARDIINNMSDEYKASFEKGEVPMIELTEFVHELYTQMSKRIDNGDYTVDIDDFEDTIRHAIIGYIGITHLLHERSLAL